MKKLLRYKEDMVMESNIFGAKHLSFIKRLWIYDVRNSHYDSWGGNLRLEPLEHCTYYIFDTDFLGDYTLMELMDKIDKMTFKDEGIKI